MVELITNEGKRKWLLQLFAEGDPDNEPGNDGGGSNDNGKPEPLTFDAFLKLEGNQAEFDRRIQKACKTAVSNAQEKWEALTNDKLSEAEKLAKMTKEEKALYKAQQLEKELEMLRGEKVITEMTNTARKMLVDEGINIPDELLSSLVSKDAEQTKKTVESFVEIFKGAVNVAVKEALKGEPPKKGDGNKLTKEQIMAIKDPIERQKKIAENLDLFN